MPFASSSFNPQVQFLQAFFLATGPHSSDIISGSGFTRSSSNNKSESLIKVEESMGSLMRAVNGRRIAFVVGFTPEILVDPSISIDKRPDNLSSVSADFISIVVRQDRKLIEILA